MIKTKDKQKLHQDTIPALEKKLIAAQKELTLLRLKIKSGKEKNLKSAKTKRKQIAFIKTLLTLKKIETKIAKSKQGE